MRQLQALGEFRDRLGPGVMERLDDARRVPAQPQAAGYQTALHLIVEQRRKLADPHRKRRLGIKKRNLSHLGSQSLKHKR